MATSYVIIVYDYDLDISKTILIWFEKKLYLLYLTRLLSYSNRGQVDQHIIFSLLVRQIVCFSITY